MTFLRLQKQRIGLFLAVFLAMAAASPGLLAAAKGIQVQALICSPNATKNPIDYKPAFLPEDHCQICPIGSLEKLAALRVGAVNHLKSQHMVSVAVFRSERLRWFRAELFPVQGRSPPAQI